MSKLAQHEDEIRARLAAGETKAAVARSLGVPVTTLKTFIGSSTRPDANVTWAAGYASGVIDGEGCVSYYPVSGTRSVVIYNTDRSIIDGYCAALDLLDIPHRTYEVLTPQGRPAWKVYVGRKANLLKLAALSSPRSDAKQERFAAIVNSYKKVTA